jgi:histidinol-phosphate phosphatase family protein
VLERDEGFAHVNKWAAVFLDQDGTIGGDGGYCHPDDFALFPHSYEAIHLLNQAGLKVIVVTNQTRVGKGEITLAHVHASFQRLNSQLRGDGAYLDGWYVCPHLPEDQCDCRKPSPGLLQLAATELALDLSRSYVVGDVGSTDILAGVAAGCYMVLVKTGWGRDSLGPYRHLWAEAEPDFVADDILEAACWIVGQPTDVYERTCTHAPPNDLELSPVDCALLVCGFSQSSHIATRTASELSRKDGQP